MLKVRGRSVKKKFAIVLDIDGVLLDNSETFKGILNLGLKGDEKWDYFYDNCNKAPLICETLNFLNCISKNVDIILSTARNEKCRALTEARLKNDFVPFTYIYMRTNNDLRPSPEVKEEHLKAIMKKYSVIAFIDDDILNCEAAKKLGILALRKV